MILPEPARGGFDAHALCSTIGAAQRAGLERGLCVALALALSGLMVVYGPLAWDGARAALSGF